jgi:hypothetical protein
MEGPGHRSTSCAWHRCRHRRCAVSSLAAWPRSSCCCVRCAAEPLVDDVACHGVLACCSRVAAMQHAGWQQEGLRSTLDGDVTTAPKLRVLVCGEQLCGCASAKEHTQQLMVAGSQLVAAATPLPPHLLWQPRARLATEAHLVAVAVGEERVCGLARRVAAVAGQPVSRWLCRRVAVSCRVEVADAPSTRPPTHPTRVLQLTSTSAKCTYRTPGRQAVYS